MQPKPIVIYGPTASGKTAYAVKLAMKLNAEVINADSQQVYRELPILTAQPSEDERSSIAHHLYGCISVRDEFNAALWVSLAKSKMAEVAERGKRPILVGGTGLYIKSLVDGISSIPPIAPEIKEQVASMDSELLSEQLLKLDPHAHERLNKNDLVRRKRALEVVLSTGIEIAKWQEQASTSARNGYEFKLLLPNREKVYDSINRRVHKMVAEGVVDEVSNIVNNFKGVVLPKAHGLPEFSSYVLGDVTLTEAIATTQQNVRNYAKRQFTWARHQFDFDEVIEV